MMKRKTDAEIARCVCLLCQTGGRRSRATSYPSFLLEVGDHDDNADVLLPDHPPEVLLARSERPLSSDVRPRPLITLQKENRYVVKTTLPWGCTIETVQ